jgi:hypothetical protein
MVRITCHTARAKTAATMNFDGSGTQRTRWPSTEHRRGERHSGRGWYAQELQVYPHAICYRWWGEGVLPESWSQSREGWLTAPRTRWQSKGAAGLFIPSQARDSRSDSCRRDLHQQIPLVHATSQEEDGAGCCDFIAPGKLSGGGFWVLGSHQSAASIAR